MKETSPVSAVATPTNGGNLVDEFEETFQYCLNVLTKEEAVSLSERDEIKVEVEHTTYRFIDLARQMEAFFLQKRFLLSALKPEMIIKEDISELRLELARKEEILKRHAEKINVWQNILNDLKNFQHNTSTCKTGAAVNTPGTPGTPGNGNNQNNNTGGCEGEAIVPNPEHSMMQPEQTSFMGHHQVSGGELQTGNNNGLGIAPTSKNLMGMNIQQHQMQVQQQEFNHLQQFQQLQQQQQLLQQQQQQQQMVPMGMQQQPQQVVGSGMISPEVLFQHQSSRLPFSQQQGPLAYLEKTTSNIGLTDGRR